ncbi:MAG TPA: threonine synthase [Bryobacteraceae bacterium]|nr:threonine synthase [Bryobacteraceae bacterium]
MPVNLVCFSPVCGEKYATSEVLYQCPRCGGLLELQYEYDAAAVPAWKKTWRERRMDNSPINQSGVWRYREMLPFDGEVSAVTLREGNTPLLESPITAAYAGLDRLLFKHQGFNPTGSFKDNGMTCGVTQARLLGKRVVACVSTGNTSASMAAYASAAGLKAVIFLPQGNISFGKLAQALEYGALTLQVEANFDEILALVRQVADCAGVYLLNSINPFRIEGQKTMAIEMADQLDWRVPDWVVMPGGNLGNTAAFGKGFLELHEAGLIGHVPRIAVIQAAGAAPFFDYVRGGHARFEAVRKPETLATAIRIGDPVSWPKAEAVLRRTRGAVDTVTEQEIADAKAVIGRSGIGCEPASAATLAGIRKMTALGIIRSDESVVAILTGNVLKDPDYIYRYHLGELKSPDGSAIAPNFGNRPHVVQGEPNAIIKLLQAM